MQQSEQLQLDLKGTAKMKKTMKTIKGGQLNRQVERQVIVASLSNNEKFSMTSASMIQNKNCESSVNIIVKVAPKTFLEYVLKG